MTVLHRLVLCLAVGSPAMAFVPAAAQTVSDTVVVPDQSGDTARVDLPAPRPREHVDIRAFRYVYGQQGPVFSTTMRQVNSASRRIFVAAIPVSATATLVTGSDFDPTVRLAASSIGSYGAVTGIKALARRPRPYNGLEGIEARVRVPEVDPDPFSLPSGHSAVSFAMATSTTLSYPRWYVAVPAYTWATATALARVWHGVHYPSDIILGAALGTATAGLVHLILPEVDPDDPEAAGAAPPAITIALPLR